MKTHIIRLESHDDVTSIRDKMSWSRAARILLVFPKTRAPGLTAVDLNLVVRQASQLGGQLGLVTHDRETIARARELSIPIFASIAQAQRSPWLLARRRKRLILRTSRIDSVLALKEKIRPEMSKAAPQWARLAFFGLGFAALLGLILFFYPSATITISPQNMEQELNLKVWAKPDMPGALASGGMPAQVQTVVVQGSADGPTSAVVAVPDKYAEGTLELTNLTENEVIVPAGTVFAFISEAPIRFASTVSITIPAGVGSKAEVKITATAPGSSGNLPPNSITGIEDAVGLSITATNPEPTTGGSDREARAASEQDFDALYDSLFTRLSETALLKMGEIAGETKMVVLSSLKAKEILADERTPENGQPAERIQMDLRIEFSALTIEKTDVETVARLALDAGLPSGYLPGVDGLSITNLTDPVLNVDGIARWEIRAARAITPAIDTQAILSRIVGQPLEKAETILAEQIELQTKPEVRLTPDWWGRMPYIPFRIQMVVK